MLRGFDLIDVIRQPGLRVFNVPIRIDHSGSLLKDRLDLLRNTCLTFEIGTVDFGN